MQDVEMVNYLFEKGGKELLLHEKQVIPWEHSFCGKEFRRLTASVVHDHEPENYVAV